MLQLLWWGKCTPLRRCWASWSDWGKLMVNWLKGEKNSANEPRLKEVELYKRNLLMVQAIFHTTFSTLSYPHSCALRARANEATSSDRMSSRTTVHDWFMIRPAIRYNDNWCNSVLVRSRFLSPCNKTISWEWRWPFGHVPISLIMLAVGVLIVRRECDCIIALTQYGYRFFLTRYLVRR